MPKRIKKPLVTPAMRKEWLRRYEEDGQSAARIAETDKYDVRTVRKQIELMRQEREAREARFIVIRQALEKHYADLLFFAEKLDSGIIQSRLPGDVKIDRMWTALHEHLPHSPLWKMIDKMERLNDEIQDIEKRAMQRVREEIEKEIPFDLLSQPGKAGLYGIALIGAVNYHLHANAPCPLLELRTSNTSGGLTQIYYEGWLCSTVTPDQVEKVKGFITGLMAQVCQWPEYEELRRVLTERVSIIEAISEELATIILRRVIPGRCKYCPI